MRNKKEKEKENNKKKVLKIKTFTAKRGGRMDAKKCVFFFLYKLLYINMINIKLKGIPCLKSNMPPKKLRNYVPLCIAFKWINNLQPRLLAQLEKKNYPLVLR
jgi:hypothetical protein